jgi:hypothetical protein
MKSKTAKMNALFGLLSVGFMLTFFSLLPAPPTQGQAPSKPGMRMEKPATVPAAEVVDTLEPVPVEPAPTPTPAPTGGVTVDMNWLLNKQNAIAAALMLLLTFLSKWIPGLNKIGDTGKRALVVAGTVIAALLAVKFIGTDPVNWGDFVSLVITYLLTALGYDKALKPAGIVTPKTPTA